MKSLPGGIRGIARRGTALGIAAMLASAHPARASEVDTPTSTPIKHLLVIIGENQSFDHIFATYRAPSGDAVANLLSRKIINVDGGPGPNFNLAAQSSATETGTSFQLAPTNKIPYALLPAQTTGELMQGASDTDGPPFATFEGALAHFQTYYHSFARLFHPGDLTKGANPLPEYVPDTRIANVNKLPNGPFQVTGKTPYDFYTASPNHAFFPEWQEADCAVAHATADNPSGCLNDLVPWAETTRSGNNIGGGGVGLSFYNVARGDVPYLTALASRFTLADNYHQPMRGPSSPNWVYFGAADEYFFSDGNGHPVKPPASLIVNPDPMPGANNTPINDNANFVGCADPTQPGVSTILSYLAALPYHPGSGCEAGTYYHVATRDPGYLPNGSLNPSSNALPPSSVPTIGEQLSAKGVSWSWYAGGWDLYVANTSDISPGYCDNCNPFQFSTAVMSTAASRQAHLHDAEDLLKSIRAGTMPSVAFLRSEDAPSGHPDDSKMKDFENYVRVFVEEVRAQPKLWADTAILVTFDEGGGYYDSGYVQPIDFFGDGVRTPMIAISRFSTGGHVSHVYADHASVVKFIERNWGLDRLSPRSRDNLPLPEVRLNPYIPVNPPAIGDLTDLFDFRR